MRDAIMGGRWSPRICSTLSSAPVPARIWVNIDAVAIFLDHPRNAAHLALDAARRRSCDFFTLSSIEPYPQGMGGKCRPTSGPRAATITTVTATRLDGDTAIDPVCGMTGQKAGAKNTTEHDGRTWFFCSSAVSVNYRRADAPPPKSAPAEAAAVAPAGADPTLSHASADPSARAGQLSRSAWRSSRRYRPMSNAGFRPDEAGGWICSIRRGADCRPKDGRPSGRSAPSDQPGSVTAGSLHRSSSLGLG